MILKDLLDVFGGIEVSIARPIFDKATSDWKWDDIYSGWFPKMPPEIYGLKVGYAEPNADGLNIDLEEIIKEVSE